MIDQATLEELCIQLGCTISDLKLLGGYNHNVFEVTAHEPFVVKIVTNSPSVRKSLLSEMEWAHYLQSKGASAVMPLLSEQGAYVREISNQNCFVAFRKIVGNHVNPKDQHVWNRKLFKQWGAAMGNMHVQAKSFHPEHRSPYWYEHRLFKSEPLSLDPPLLDRWRSNAARLSELPVSKETFGLIHSDLTHHNFLYHDDQLTILDFGDIEYHWFAYDIAVSVYHAVQTVKQPEERAEFAKRFFEAFMEGYAEFNDHSGLISQVDFFIDYRHLFSYVYHCESIDPNQLTAAQRQYMNNMRESLLRSESYLGFSLV